MKYRKTQTDWCTVKICIALFSQWKDLCSVLRYFHFTFQSMHPSHYTTRHVQKGGGGGSGGWSTLSPLIKLIKDAPSTCIKPLFCFSILWNHISCCLTIRTFSTFDYCLQKPENALKTMAGEPQINTGFYMCLYAPYNMWNQPHLLYHAYQEITL